MVRRKNPYLYRSKEILTANDFIKDTLDAFLYSSEATLFGSFLENLSIFVCSKVYNGRKSATEGIDLEFESDCTSLFSFPTKYIVSIKSGPNWSNSSEVKKMIDYFKKAKKVLKTNNSTNAHIVAVNGCCYGRDNTPDKGEYFKLCGQRYWEFMSGNSSLYIDIIKPLGINRKHRNEQFVDEYAKVINKLSLEFIQMFCDSDGKIQWEKIVKFNSSIEDYGKSKEL